jgi:hypothetical protein
MAFFASSVKSRTPYLPIRTSCTETLMYCRICELCWVFSRVSTRSFTLAVSSVLKKLCEVREFEYTICTCVWY